MSCKTCQGTGLHPLLKPGTEQLLFTQEECRTCGGKGYVQGGRRYAVVVYRNGNKTATIEVLARTAPEALKLAAELIATAMEEKGRGDLLRTGDVLGLEVIE